MTINSLRSSKALLLLVPAVVVVITIVLVYIFTRSDDTGLEWAVGEALLLSVVADRTSEKVAYTELVDQPFCPDAQGGHFVIEPSQEDKEFQAFFVYVYNLNSTSALLQVGQNAAELVDSKGNKYSPVDPCEASVEIDTPDPEDGLYNPFMWGNIDLPQGHQVEGWMLFEVPPGTDPVTFNWQETERITAGLQ